MNKIIVTATFHEKDRRKRLGKKGRFTSSWQDLRELVGLCAHFWDRIETDPALMAFSISLNDVEVCARSKEWFISPGVGEATV